MGWGGHNCGVGWGMRSCLWCSTPASRTPASCPAHSSATLWCLRPAFHPPPHLPTLLHTQPSPPPQAFDTPEQPYLPDEVLYRQKEQFSDGVGYDWVDGLKEYAAKVRGLEGAEWGVGLGR